MILLCFFFFFLVIFNNFFTIPVVTINIYVNEYPAVPTGIPTIVACETMLNVPNDGNNPMKILSAGSKATMYLLIYLTISFRSLISRLK